MTVPSSQSTADYDRIAAAIGYISQHMQGQPSLQDVADHLQLSPFHTQRLFKRWAGVSPKQFLQVLTVERAKQILAETRSLLDASLATGLSGSSRLHDHFVSLEAMTPGDFKRQGQGLCIRFGLHPSPFGEVLIGMTERGICHLAFTDSDTATGIADLQRQWPLAQLQADQTATAATVAQIFQQGQAANTPLSVHVSGTNFQVQVWKALLRIRPGQALSYGDIATALDRPGASRAVGSAVGANPVALLIPCHRVIRQSGELGGYRWGLERKQALWVWEGLHLSVHDDT